MSEVGEEGSGNFACEADRSLRGYELVELASDGQLIILYQKSVA